MQAQLIFSIIAVALDAEFAFLLEEKEVPQSMIDKLKEYGMKTLDHFILMASNHAELKRIANDEWQLDPSSSKGNRLGMVCLLDAWDDATIRVQSEREADADARQQGLPKQVGKRPPTS